MPDNYVYLTSASINLFMGKVFWKYKIPNGRGGGGGGEEGVSFDLEKSY